MEAEITQFGEAVDIGSGSPATDVQFFKNLFPETYETKIISYQFNNYECTGGTCHARIALRTKEEFIEWLGHHQRKSGIIYRLRRTRRSDGKYCLYKADYRCQHNTLAHYNKSKNPSKKHTLCPAKLSVTIKTSPRKTRSKDAYLKCYPAVIHINHVHNHPIQYTDYHQYQKPPVAVVKQKYLSLLKVNRMPKPVQVQKSELMEVESSYFDSATQVGQQDSNPNVNWIYLPNIDNIDGLNLQGIQGNDVYEISEVRNSGESTTYVVNVKNEAIPVNSEGGTIRLVASSANGEHYELHMENNETSVSETRAQPTEL